MTSKLRFGIVGAGVIGKLHAEAISSLPDAELVAIADRVPERAQKLGAAVQATPYDDYKQMLEREQLDIINVCTPSGLHGEHACQAMRAGRHVIVEKPMEITHTAIAEMLKVQQETGVKMAVISQHRFDQASRRVYDLVQEEAFGRLVMGNAAVPWWRSQGYYDSGAWRGTWELDGGGVLMNQSIHSIDILQWLMGPVKSIYAYTDTLVHNMETEDVAVAILRFANAALGTITATTGAYPGTGTRIEIYGDKGSAVIADDNLSYLHLARDESEDDAVGFYGLAKEKRQQGIITREETGRAAQDPASLAIRSHVLQIADMMQAIREDGTPLVDGNAAKHPVEIILAIYESARTHQEVILS
jgi:UDP-N-acetyl-2-amino-2-deoxyglucuronate dehydrogenase